MALLGATPRTLGPIPLNSALGPSFATMYFKHCMMLMERVELEEMPQDEIAYTCKATKENAKELKRGVIDEELRANVPIIVINLCYKQSNNFTNLKASVSKPPLFFPSL